MKKYIIIAIVSISLLGIIGISIYPSYSTKKWVEENWNNEWSLGYAQNLDQVKAWVNYRDSLSAKTEKQHYSFALLRQLFEASSIHKSDLRNLIDILKYLIENGADPNFVKADNQYARDAIMLTSRISNIAPDTQIEIYQMLFDAGAKILTEETTQDGVLRCSSPLKNVDVKVFKFLLEKAKDKKYHADFDSLKTCTAIAILQGGTRERYHHIKTLLDYGLNSRILSPLLAQVLQDASVFKKDVNIANLETVVRDLIKHGADINYVDPDGFSIKQNAAKVAIPSIFKFINEAETSQATTK